VSTISASASGRLAIFRRSSWCAAIRNRLGWVSFNSEREALIESNDGGIELFQAEANESTGAFHRRLVAIARAKSVRVISLGSDTPVAVSRQHRRDADHRELRAALEQVVLKYAIWHIFGSASAPPPGKPA